MGHGRDGGLASGTISDFRSLFASGQSLSRARIAPLPEGRHVPAVSTSGSGTILIVDDEPVILQLVARILGRAGYRVLEARDADEATKQSGIPDLQVDAVVLDLSVFQEGLPAALERLHAAFGPVGMVVVSGAPLAAGERVLLERRHHRYLSKPFAPGEIVEAVQAVIEG